MSEDRAEYQVRENRFIVVAPGLLIDPGLVAAIETKTSSRKCADSPADTEVFRNTLFKSVAGAVLLELATTVKRSSDLDDSNIEFKRIERMHQEAIACVREHRDFKPN